MGQPAATRHTVLMHRRFGPLVILLVASLAMVGCTSGGGDDAASTQTGDSGTIGDLPAAAKKIMDKPAYQAARWTYQVTDLKTGKVLMANRAGEMAFTASTAKQFTVGAVYNTMGPDSRVTTPVYATGPVTDGVVNGDLSLVASGDMTMGGRNAAKDHADDSFSSKTIDHVYGDLGTNAAKAPGNPLAGLESLAKQVADAGIRQVSGNVLIDDRLWEPFAGGEGTVQPMFINDNVLDITVTPGTSGATATLEASPATSAYQVSSQVKTESGSDVSLKIAADPNQPRNLVVTGSIGADAGPRLTIYRIPDPASWARTLFIEALQRAGVSVAADPLAVNNEGALPAKDSYTATAEVAKFQLPPVSAFGALILRTSYNTGANTLLCLLAVHEGSTDCVDGLKPIRAMADKAGLNASGVVLVDGQGADPASIPPAQMVKYLRWTHDQSWGAALKAGQPVLGETGTLSSDGENSPAKGKIQAKTGTSAHGVPGTDRILYNVQRLAGFMTAPNGDQLVFDVAMSGGVYPDIATALSQAGNDVSDVAAAIQQAMK
jgi:serine-type D-Ala-D-Ala carboxypeptidase/endopeptidase (penicillin-binding protein 4)